MGEGAFDLDKLAGGKIVVKQAGDNNKFTTLDGEERKISKESIKVGNFSGLVMLVIGSNNLSMKDLLSNIINNGIDAGYPD